jgi:hypothetical protein
MSMALTGAKNELNQRKTNEISVDQKEKRFAKSPAIRPLLRLWVEAHSLASTNGSLKEECFETSLFEMNVWR